MYRIEGGRGKGPVRHAEEHCLSRPHGASEGALDTKPETPAALAGLHGHSPRDKRRTHRLFNRVSLPA